MKPLEIGVIRLCRSEDIGPGQVRGFDPASNEEDTVFVLRHPEGLRAYENHCPHQGVRLEYRKDRFLSADGRFIVCYAHGARFDPLTGHCYDGACLGQTLRRLACHEHDGWLWCESP